MSFSEPRVKSLLSHPLLEQPNPTLGPGPRGHWTCRRTGHWAQQRPRLLGHGLTPTLKGQGDRRGGRRSPRLSQGKENTLFRNNIFSRNHTLKGRWKLKDQYASPGTVQARGLSEPRALSGLIGILLPWIKEGFLMRGKDKKSCNGIHISWVCSCFSSSISVKESLGWMHPPEHREGTCQVAWHILVPQAVS